ncbi:DUF4157 domain-containing protein [Kitasatospora sp. NPDC087314]|uniref:eCIS core domain-containing protein n=1 Tax=Kitasatospora sp. NPDC087314 TaxID=3364068 RepID=UPI0037FDE2CD
MRSHQTPDTFRTTVRRGGGQLAEHPARTAARAARTGGAVLDPVTRAWADTRFGHDFGDVRVHSDGSSTRALGAAAFTVGSDIVFAPGRYSPGTASGRRLLTHELAHVRQQRGLTAPPTAVGLPDTAAEQQADRAAELVGTGLPPPGTWRAPPAGTIQRHPDGPCPAPPQWEPESAAERWIYEPANKLIEDAYRAEHRKSKDRVLVGSQFLYGGSPHYGITLPRGPDGEEDKAASAFLGDLRGIARQLAPDIIDFEERAIYEIKTHRFRDAGQGQLEHYYELAHSLQVKHGGKPWNRQTAATWYPKHVLGPLEGSPDRVVCTAETEYEGGQEGLILYQVYRRVGREREPQPVAPGAEEAAERARALAALAEAGRALRRKYDFYSGDHKIQAELIDKPSASGFAGFWVNRLFNSEIPPQTIWLNTDASLAALDSSVRTGDVRRAVESLIRGRREFLKAMKRYVTWKEGVEPAAAKAKVAIGVVAVTAVLAFVAPQLLARGAPAPGAQQVIVRIAEVVGKYDELMLEEEALETEAEIAADAEREAELALHE